MTLQVLGNNTVPCGGRQVHISSSSFEFEFDTSITSPDSVLDFRHDNYDYTSVLHLVALVLLKVYLRVWRGIYVLAM